MKIEDIERITLGPGDVLAVKVRSDEIRVEEIAQLRAGLQGMFPQNKVWVSILPVNSDMELSVITPEQEALERKESE